jgi:hypothetical protein
MACGAAYDLCFATAILFFTAPAAAILGLAVPADPVYLRLNGVFLVLLAAVYALPAAAPRRYSGIVVVAIAGRTLGFLYFALVWSAGAPTVFIALGAVDLLFGLTHAVLLWRAGGLSVQPEQNTGA